MNRTHRSLTLLTGLTAAGLVLWKCTSVPQAPQQAHCATKSERLGLNGRNVDLPATGVFVLESHLATDKDFGPGEFPDSPTVGIVAHLGRSCAVLGKGSECQATVYPTTWHKQWTPPEGGKYGQGSISKKPTVEQEMWTCNMNWLRDTRPPPGEKWLMTSGSENVVVSMGFETGPADQKYLGGCQGEIFWQLKAEPQRSPLKLGRLLDQSLAYGPVVCQ